MALAVPSKGAHICTVAGWTSPLLAASTTPKLTIMVTPAVPPGVNASSTALALVCRVSSVSNELNVSYVTALASHFQSLASVADTASTWAVLVAMVRLPCQASWSKVSVPKVVA